MRYALHMRARAYWHKVGVVSMMEDADGDSWNEDVEFAKVAEAAERYEDMSKVILIFAR
jgi:hypothetical protein